MKGFLPYLFMLPALTIWYLILLYPLIFTFYLSFFKWNGFTNQAPVFVGIKNYVNVFTSPNFQVALTNTILWVVASLFGLVLLGLFLAAVINFRVRFSRFIRVAVLLPYMLPVSAAAFIWRFVIYDPGTILDTFLSSVGLGFLIRSWLSDLNVAIYSMVVVQLWIGIGIQTLILSSGMGGINPSLYDSAKIDGASLIQRFTKITLPLMTDIIMVSITLVTAGALTTFSIPYIMGGGGTVSRNFLTLATSSFQTSFMFFDVGGGFAIAWIMALIVFAVTYPIIRRVWMSKV